jgi:hypothetical protein
LKEEELRVVKTDLELMEAARVLQAAEYVQQFDDQGARNEDVLEHIRAEIQSIHLRRSKDSDRLEDHKLEMSRMEKQHTLHIADLEERIKFLDTSASSRSAGFALVTTDPGLVDRMQKAEVERNELRMELENKENQWKSQYQQVQQELAEDLEGLSQVEHELEKEQVRFQQLHAQLAEKQTLFDTCNLSQPVAAESPPMLSLLRCPIRARFWGESEAKAVPENDTSCQEVCWHLMTLMPNLTALQCSSGSFEILDASKNAYVLWGSRTLHGSSLLDLLPDKSMSVWLRKRLEAGASTDDFYLRHIPCVALRDQRGGSSEYSLVCADLPAEPKHGKAAALIVVARALAVHYSAQQGQSNITQSDGASSDSADQVKRPREWQRVRRAYGTPSGLSDDITANDSISNVFAAG